MAFQVKDLMFVLDPSAPLPMHLTCGPISVDTQCPTASALQPRKEEQFDCTISTDTACGTTSCAFDSGRLNAVPVSRGGLHRLRRQLAEVRERGAISFH